VPCWNTAISWSPSSNAIATILKTHPKLRFTVEASYPERLIGRLRQGELDVVVGALPQNRADPDLRYQRLTTDTIGVVARAGHPLLRRPGRDLADYAACAWALPNRAELLRQRLDKVFRDAGLGEPRTAIESDSLSLLLATVRFSDCVTLATSQTLQSDEARGIVALEHDALRFRREAGLISRRHVVFSPAVQLLASELRPGRRPPASYLGCCGETHDGSATSGVTCLTNRPSTRKRTVSPAAVGSNQKPRK
jgi:DNA-binding transcriptional LysR family regulator